jgi:hypothetical protein
MESVKIESTQNARFFGRLTRSKDNFVATNLVYIVGLENQQLMDAVNPGTFGKARAACVIDTFFTQVSF